MTGLVRGMTLCAALAAAHSAVAQPAASPDDQSPIVVTGQRNTEQDMKDFVEALTPGSAGGQLSRFERAVCPVAIGLPQRDREAVAGRMRRVANEAGIAVGGAKCVPNVVVMVTQDKTVLMQLLRRRYGHYFGDLPNSKIRELVRQPGPAVAWQLQGPQVNARGVELPFDQASGVAINRTTDPGSRITAAARPQFAGSVVVVERAALAGLTVTQLADYAAMRAFAHTEPSRLGSSGTPTILRVLEAPMGSEVPPSLTAWDLAFLRGFYAAPRNVRTGAQRSAIRRSITKEAERSTAE